MLGDQGKKLREQKPWCKKNRMLKMHPASINSLFNLFNVLVHDISDKKREIVFTLNAYLT